MGKENCVLLSNMTDLAKVVDRLQTAFGTTGIEIVGDKSAWTRVSISRRKLFRMSQVAFVPLDETQLGEIQRRLRHVYLSVHPEIPALHTKLLAKIATSRLAIEVEAPNGLRGLEDIVFEVSEALDAIIFWDGCKMLDKKGRLVMDFEGKSGVGDLDVVVDADLLDQHTAVTELGLARKARSEAALKKRLVPLNKKLPPIASEEAVTIRSIEDVAQRALALMLVAVKGEGLEDKIVQRILEDYGIAPFLSPAELAFIQDTAPSQQDRVNFTWRYEALATMLWALGYEAGLDFPDTICDVGACVTTIRESGGYAGFLAGAKLRTPTEILDARDLIYRLHWAVVDARLRGQAAPNDMEAGVVYERHYALNWLTGYLDQDWDDVSTDT